MVTRNVDYYHHNRREAMHRKIMRFFLVFLVSFFITYTHGWSILKESSECNFNPVWNEAFQSAEIIQLEQTNATEKFPRWERADINTCNDINTTCWKKENVYIADNVLILEVRRSSEEDSSSKPPSAAKISIVPWPFPTDIYGAKQLRFQAKMTEDPAVISKFRIYIPSHDLNVSLSWEGGESIRSNEVLLAWEDQDTRTSVQVELPCNRSVTQEIHEYMISWDDNFLRWHVDDNFLYETFLGPPRMIDSAFLDLSFEAFAINHTASIKMGQFQVHSISFSTGNDTKGTGSCSAILGQPTNCRQQIDLTIHLGSNAGFLSLDEVSSFLNYTASSDLSHMKLTRVEEIGKSLENRSILALCLGLCSQDMDKKTPQVLLTGMHHSREPISMMNLVYTIDFLVNGIRNGMMEVLELLLSRQLWFVLVVNPDGYAINEKLKTWENYDLEAGQRKNARPGCEKQSNIGVDLNRNYDFCFNEDSVGSSKDTCADDYKGTGPFSEPETKAIKAFVEAQNFQVSLNYHSYGGYFNIPFACQPKGKPPIANLSVYESLAKEMTRLNGFSYGQPWAESNLYSVDGETSDWMFNTHGIYAMSPETGPNFDVPTHEGFWPPKNQIEKLAAELLYSNLFAARVAGPIYQLEVKSINLALNKQKMFVTVSITNVGLGKSSKPLEIIGSLTMNGTETASSELYAVETKGKLGNEESVIETIQIPLTASQKKLPDFFYILLRDPHSSCLLYRISLGIDTKLQEISTFEVWESLPLPLCGTCQTFGATRSNNSHQTLNLNSICESTLKDVVHLKEPDSRLLHTEQLVLSSRSPSPTSISSVPSPTNQTNSSMNSNSISPIVIAGSQKGSLSSDIASGNQRESSSASNSGVVDVGTHDARVDTSTKRMLLVLLLVLLFMVIGLVIMQRNRRVEGYENGREKRYEMVALQDEAGTSREKGGYEDEFGDDGLSDEENELMFTSDGVSNNSNNSNATRRNRSPTRVKTRNCDLMV